MGQIFRGIFPFWIAMLLCICLLVAFPEIALVIPNTMFGR
jgi:TRAP-type C4-dicarboxylate transport system permease large subunit